MHVKHSIANLMLLGLLLQLQLELRLLLMVNESHVWLWRRACLTGLCALMDPIVFSSSLGPFCTLPYLDAYTRVGGVGWGGMIAARIQCTCSLNLFSFSIAAKLIPPAVWQPVMNKRGLLFMRNNGVLNDNTTMM